MIERPQHIQVLFDELVHLPLEPLVLSMDRQIASFEARLLGLTGLRLRGECLPVWLLAETSHRLCEDQLLYLIYTAADRGQPGYR